LLIAPDVIAQVVLPTKLISPTPPPFVKEPIPVVTAIPPLAVSVSPAILVVVLPEAIDVVPRTIGNPPAYTGMFNVLPVNVAAPLVPVVVRVREDPPLATQAVPFQMCCAADVTFQYNSP
jgi:hypothetical protein